MMKKIAMILLSLLILSSLLFISSCGTDDNKGVIIVLIDALRRSDLGIYGYDRDTSPFMDNLSTKSVFFSNMWSAAPQTVPSCASLMTGLYPYKHGAHFFSVPQSYHPTKPAAEGGLPRLSKSNRLVSEYLKEKGIFTAAISSNPNVVEKYGFGQGFDYFNFLSCYWEIKAQVCDGMTINTIFENEVIPKIGSDDFFVYLHYMDVHNPYFKPHSFKGKYRQYKGEPVYKNGKVPDISREELEYSRACYDECISYMDSVVEDLLRILEERNLSDKTLVIITSDHGDEFLEHGGMGHGTTCYNELTGTFAIFSNPKMKARRVEQQVGNVDIMPTILDWFGVIYDSKNIDGVSLYSYLENKEVPSGLSNRMFISELGDRKAVVDGKFKYIYNLDKKIEELYDLEKDRSEQKNLADEMKNKAALYREFIKKIVKVMKVAYSDVTLTEKELKDLKSLGYIN